MAFFRQLGLMMWKNWLLHRRKPCTFIFEIILPVLFAILILAMRGLVKPKTVNNNTFYSPQSLHNTSFLSHDITIGFVPNYTVTNKIMEDVVTMFNNRTMTSMGFNSEEDLLSFYMDHPPTAASNTTTFGVVFNGLSTTPSCRTLSLIVSDPLQVVLTTGSPLVIISSTKAMHLERALLESMRLMGLKPSVHWLSWFLTSFIFLVVAMAFYAILFGIPVNGGAVLNNTNMGLFYVFLLCYAISLITFCFMISAITQKGAGAQWSNFHQPATVDDNFALLHAMIMLLVDAVIYLLITWYIDNVHPGEFGVPKPVYFCFTKSYWLGSKGYVKMDSDTTDTDGKHFEQEPSFLRPGIQICNLTKKFGKGKVAVNSLKLNMYEGQITVLLGHNGAGKTTTMSMITGFIPPTSGTALMNGLDIRTDIDTVRKSLGLCPQHDILYDTLTVEEHLTFFAKVSGSLTVWSFFPICITIADIDTNMYNFLLISQNLSGGQKRKLSVGIALISGSKIVVLDEPSSGMDPAARRQTWELTSAPSSREDTAADDPLHGRG
ncbi:hypothetical protein C0Q70_15510 [Pomacea canaliculata]|uniref:ABC transporter domain-containing protein n=1 Tax=Pomacea canaliculata TaxID=400727 RepID=A0A2T7NV22_POMCA|nr:hypothetical protein C0Q70_15510 [Pomacea canaliculata]